MQHMCRQTAFPNPAAALPAEVVRPFSFHSLLHLPSTLVEEFVEVFIGDSYPLCQEVPMFNIVPLLILPIGVKFTLQIELNTCPVVQEKLSCLM